MKFISNFRVQIVLRSLFLGLLLFLFVYLLNRPRLYSTLIIVGFLIFYSMYSLIHFIEKTNRDLSRFLQSIRYADFSQSFNPRGMGSSFKDLNHSFTEVIKDFQVHRAEKEEQFRYMQIIVQHVGIGLITFDTEGSVHLINKAAKQIFDIPGLNNISNLHPFGETLVDDLINLKAGEKTLVKASINDELLQLAVHAAEFLQKDKKFKLVSLQNIQTELEEKEMEAWQTLIRILTHEIMNSMTPISSLANTAMGLLQGIEVKHQPQTDNTDTAENMIDIHNALVTIHNRSHGLTHFVNSYRNLTLIPKPVYSTFPVLDLVQRVDDLMKNRLAESGIAFDSKVTPADLILTADTNLIEQVLINLILNAIDALDGISGANISVYAALNERNQTVIEVSDNGPGIVDEALEKIFIPFYTTKKKGSGIGLSLSRQIMRLHGGALTARSESGGTTFSLRFRVSGDGPQVQVK